jgi:Ca-activated chloride channel family protein
MLQNTKDDYTAIIAFSNRTLAKKDRTGNSRQEMLSLYDWVKSLAQGGGTDIFSPVTEAFEILDLFDDSYIKSVVLMTDGVSNAGMSADQFERYIKNNGVSVPVFSIMFGNASNEQLSKIADLTLARVFDGRKDMIAAFRQVRGYN